jgi:hypothetical protein
MDLKRFQWKNRLLLLFAPDASTPEYVEQWNKIYKHLPGMEDRDLLVMSFFEADGGDFDGDEIDDASVEEIRRRFRIKRGMIAAVLVGKDGTEKLRKPLPADVQPIFDLIDSMPMLQREMEQDDE